MFKTFPHYVVHYKDESAETVLRVADLPLHRPIFFGFAEKGKIGVPFWGNYSEAKARHGMGTFDYRSDCFYHPNLFYKRALMHQKAFFVRLASEDAATGSLVVECVVETGVDITQYLKDGTGARQVDSETGEWIPETEADEVTIVTEPGITITWAIRALEEDEDPLTLTPTTQDAVTTYPIMCLVADSPGAWANVGGIKLWWDHGTLDTGVVTDIEAMMYNFGLVLQPYELNTVQPIRNVYNDPTSSFTFKPDAIDSSVDRRVTFADVLQNDYDEAIPFEITTYGGNVKTIGDLIVALEPTVDELADYDGWMANIMTGRTTEGLYYDHVEVKTDGIDGAVALDEDIIQYLSGGSDGTISNAALESLTKTWLTEGTFPDITDEARYPITHMYDSGYEIETKKIMIDFLGIRPDVKVNISTQEVAIPANTKAEDQSAGASLRTQILLHPASTIYGTQAFRGTIYQQCSYLTETTIWDQIVPCTYDALYKKCMYQGAVKFKGKPKGFPKNEVTLLDPKRMNWYPNSDEHKQLNWNSGLNYIQYFDMERVHYPDVRSVYPLDTSVISDDIFTDQLVYLHHIARQQWAIFAGRDENPDLLFGVIEKSIADDIYDKFGSYLNATVRMYRTSVDKALGYQSSIEIAVYGNLPQRVWNIIIPVRREESEA